MFSLIRSRLSPFRHSEFRKFFFAQTASLVGSMAHDLARAWIVVEMMGRAASLGSLLVAVAIPSLLLILHGGVVVDRADVRRLMILTKSCLALAALGLAAVVEWGSVEMWMLFLFGLLEGAVVAFDAPAFQSMVVRLVPREDFQQALAISSTNFHAARMMGPVIAGLLMAWHGPSLVFLFDAVTFLAVIAVLWHMKLLDRPEFVRSRKGGLEALTEGIKYLFSHRVLRYQWLQLMITILFIYPILIVVFRTFIQKKFNLTAEEFGFAFSFPAMGSVLGALTFTVTKPEKPIRALKIGIPCAVIFLSLVPQAPTITLAAAAMGLSGYFVYLSLASVTVSMHLSVAEEFRGRMSSLVGMGFVSIGPLMAYPIGLFADQVGFNQSVFTLVAIYAVLSALLAIMHFFTHTSRLRSWLKKRHWHIRPFKRGA